MPDKSVPLKALLDDVDRALTAYGVAFSKTDGPTQEQRDEWFEQGRLALCRVRDALAEAHSVVAELHLDNMGLRDALGEVIDAVSPYMNGGGE